MFKSYSLSLNLLPDYPLAESIDRYNVWLDCEKKRTRTTLEDYLLDGKTIDCGKLENDWFPNVNADIFLSHSHKDESDAIMLAALLRERFGVNTFIDSTVWGYADDLLTHLRQKYCNPRWKGDMLVYDLNSCNQCTNHVNMILSTALSKMIDKCECLFFLNSENSISPEYKDKTHSPWIYSEIQASKMIRKRKPRRHRQAMLSKSESRFKDAITNESLDIAYDADLSHMIPFNKKHLSSWLECGERGTNALDFLYKNFTVEQLYGS